MNYKIFFKYNLTIFLIIIGSYSHAVTFDNILNALFYNDNNELYLILHESIYHPTAGAYEQGNIRSQGYNSSRISVYSMQNGKLIAQKDMGTIDSASACLVLGCSENNLWIYHKKYKSGLQSLNPITLRRGISQAKIYSNLQISTGRFIEPDWREINNYYAYDEIQQKLVITNTEDKQYYIDVNTFAAQPIDENIQLNTKLSKYLDQSVEFQDSTWRFKGYDNMKFACGTYEADKPTFLFGQFILNQNKLSLFEHYSTVQENIIESKQEALNDAQNNINDLIKGRKPNDILLQPDKNSFFILSKSSNEPDAFLSISRIESVKFGAFNTQWSVSPQGMFYNVAQARNTSAFKKYFGDIYPEFNYQFIQMQDNKLVIIFLQYVSCIDVENGNILWQFKLK